jgi:hypothetical protein
MPGRRFPFQAVEAGMDRWTWESKPVTENPDGTPRLSVLRELTRDPRSGLVEVRPGVYLGGFAARSVAGH